MFQSILVPIDLADTDLAKPAIETAASLSKSSGGSVRLVNVMPITPVMLAEYVPPDFEIQQRQSSEEALAIVATAIATVARIVCTGNMFVNSEWRCAMDFAAANEGRRGIYSTRDREAQLCEIYAFL